MDNSIETITKYLFECDFSSDSFDPENNCEHLDCSEKLLQSHMWNDIFEVWFKYLVNNCKTAEEVINFANLFNYYGGTDEIIKNPYEFLGYLYFKVDMDKYWDQAGDLFDGIAISILENAGLISTLTDPYYNVLEDPELKASISRWEVTISEHLNDVKKISSNICERKK